MDDSVRINNRLLVRFSDLLQCSGWLGSEVDDQT